MTIRFDCKDGIGYPIQNRLDGKIGIGLKLGTIVSVSASANFSKSELPNVPGLKK
jgi:hypothetical protein